MVGGPAALLSDTRRLVAIAFVSGALVAYGAAAGALPNVSEPWDVAWVALVLIPATFTLVWLTLPAAPWHGCVVVALAFGCLAVLLHLAGLGALFNVAKVFAYTFAGFAFLALFLELAWIALVAFIVPWVDAISVWRGPTDYVVSEKPGLFDLVSIEFRLPGEDASANLGPPDVLFFALFLATAQRFELRVGATWVAMTALLSLTLVSTSVFDIDGLPALPAVCIGFLVVNADRIWRAIRAG